MDKKVLFLCSLAVLFSPLTGYGYTPTFPQDNEPCSTPGAIRELKGVLGAAVMLQYCDPVKNQWGWMCGDYTFWNNAVREVVCRQLGKKYDSGIFMPYINWPRPQETGAWSNVLMSPKNIKCNGNEAKLSECQVTDYSNSPDEKIFCRLGSPVPGNEGREMACAQCSELPPATCDAPAAPANGGVTSTGNNVGATATYSCDSGYDLIGDATATCTDNGDGTGSFQPGAPTCELATCEEGLVRLAGGTLEREGRVEVCKDGEFGTVCDMKWGRADGQVVCNQLGYSTKGVLATKGDVYGEGSGPIHFNRVDCVGTEEKLVDCTSSTDTRKCDHSNDAGVKCKED